MKIKYYEMGDVTLIQRTIPKKMRNQNTGGQIIRSNTIRSSSNLEIIVSSKGGC